MSVHGEYSRALETLIVAVRALEAADREPWLQRLMEARGYYLINLMELGVLLGTDPAVTYYSV